MSKPLAYRLFKFGKLPKGVDRSTLVTQDEGIRIITTFKDFKAPGKRFSGKKRLSMGSLVTTSDRIIAYAHSVQLMNLTFDDERLKKIDFSGSHEKLFRAHFDVSHFSENSSGFVTYEFQTDTAKEVLERLGIKD